MTLVVEAIARAKLAFRSNSTCPVDSSARITAVACTRGAATTPCSAPGTVCSVSELPIPPAPAPARAAATPGMGLAALVTVEAATDPPCVLSVTARTTTVSNDATAIAWGRGTSSPSFSFPPRPDGGAFRSNKMGAAKERRHRAGKGAGR